MGPLRYTGLSTREALSRLESHGANELTQAEGTSLLTLIGRQLKGATVWLLIGAAAISLFIGEEIDAIAIGAIVILNAIVGLVQEYRADRAVLALRSMTAPKARVRRDGAVVEVPAQEVVPGDLLVLDAGDIVPADAQVLEANRLHTNEAALTGESLPVAKSTQKSDPDAPLAERSDRIFMGTTVSDGTGLAKVLKTGMRSEVGRIANLLSQSEDTETPLQNRLNHVGKTLLVLCLGLVGLVAAIGLVRGLPKGEVLLGAVSLAVAAVPEGLGAVVTVALALGVQRLVKRNVLIRNLPSVETLGCTTVICTDKTGTLTVGEMALRELWGDDDHATLYTAAACSDAELAANGDRATGDTTELALLEGAAEQGIHRSEIEATNPRQWVDPFDSDRKRMAILRQDGILYVKGALEALLPLCDAIPDGTVEAAEEMASRGLRVLAMATGHGKEATGLTLVGLAGLADPPRKTAAEAIKKAQGAGIISVMITGDHPTTATAIARELGIIGPDEDTDGRVHARATPEDKLNIIREWREKGHIVAMTGDGVNDAPALREAHIGISMGIAGTEVAREASDMILTDDDYASIVAAVEEGRGVYDNIRKSLVYLLTGNAGELALMLGAAIGGLPTPLLPLHLLWINLVTDGLPALALVMDPTDPDALDRPPRDPTEPILGKKQWSFISIVGLFEASISLAVFATALQSRPLEEARDMAFTTLVASQMLRVFAARSTRRTLWGVGAFSNLVLVGVIALTFALQLGVHLWPQARDVLHLTQLSTADWAMAIGLGFIPVTVLELKKLIFRQASP